MVGPAGLVTSREAGGAARAPAWWRRVWRRLMPPPSAELVLDQLNGQLAVLEGARAELEAGSAAMIRAPATASDDARASSRSGARPDYSIGMELDLTRGPLHA